MTRTVRRCGGWIRWAAAQRARVIGVSLVLVVAAGWLPTVMPPVVPAAGAAEPCGAEVPRADFEERVRVSPGHARVWRLYQAFFLRQPDEGGLAYWYGVRANGASLSSMARNFSASEEFRSRYGNLSDGAYVDLAYQNVLCREPEPEGRKYWVDLLRSGELTRWDMVVNFVELREYLHRTRTCHSIHPAESEAASHCARPPLRPLGEADLAADGYRARDVTVPRVAGGTGVLRGVETDITRGLLGTSGQRCSIASINGIWVAEPGKDGPTPSINGLGLVDGVHVRGSADRLDRGVVGLRFAQEAADVIRTGPDGKSYRFSSVLHHDGASVIDSWHATAERDAGGQMPPPDQWVWTVAGMVFILGGETNPAFHSDFVNDPYTHQTKNHAILAFDRETNRAFFGATSTLDTRDLVTWAQQQGYEDLVKFDGGASTEFNVNGGAVVAGTSRQIPLWFGIGC